MSENLITSIAIIPTSGLFGSDKLFDSKLNRDNRLTPYIRLREYFSEVNISLHTIDFYKDIKTIDVVIFERIEFYYLRKFIKENPSALRILIPWEPEVVEPRHSMNYLRRISKYFHYVLTWNDGLIDNLKFQKIFYPQPNIEFNNKNIRYENFKNRRMLVQVSSNKRSNHQFELYSLRESINREAYKFFNDEFSLYGKGWTRMKAYYKGELDNKSLSIQNYKYSLCLENMRSTNGYITEKIFDCFLSGVVPIYYGASNVVDYIPASTFIDFSQFSTIIELFEYIKSLSYDDWKNYIINAKSFLKSKEADKFSDQHFIKVIDKVISSDEYVKIEFKTFDELYLSIKTLTSQFHKLLSITKRSIMRIIAHLLKNTNQLTHH
jgi:alpha(1,3/1,4) fucosyltransferase